jgi:tetratricopeptide (TPR) repeat protein
VAARLTPKVAALMERGVRLMQAGEFLEAGRTFERAAQQMPNLAEAHVMRADALMRAGKLEVALSNVERGLRLRPNWGEALMLRGNIEALLERFPAAEATFREAIRVAGPTPALLGNLGNVIAEQNRLEDALGKYQAANLLSKQAFTLDRLGRRAEAEQIWRQVLEEDPGSLEAIEQLMQISMHFGRTEELDQMSARGIALAPDAGQFWIGKGLSLWSRRRHEEALQAYRKAAEVAESHDAEVFHQAATLEAVGLFALGRMEPGFARYLQRSDRASLRTRYPKLALDPAAIAASEAPLRIRIHSEQGIGDELFYLRFAPALRAKGHRLSLRTQHKLLPLLTLRDDLFDAVGLEGDPDSWDCDVELETSDLALASASFFAPSLLLRVDETRRAEFAQRFARFGPPPYIGVTWRGGLTGEERKHRRGPFLVKQVPPASLGAALHGFPATLIILQRRPDAAEMRDFCAAVDARAMDMSAANDDLNDTLALLSLLDEYVGVSNTNMHMLAAIGRGARVLVTHPPEWRWGLAGAESRWFPGFRLYRQGESGDWGAPLARLAADLSAALQQ